jgi:CHAD domain-containing protein
MGNSSSKKNQEKLFDELIEVKLLYKTKEEIRKQTAEENPKFRKMKEELSDLKNRIKIIEKNISNFGESFFDVYDSELGKPLSETDILSLRDEIKEVRYSLEAFGET